MVWMGAAAIVALITVVVVVVVVVTIMKTLALENGTMVVVDEERMFGG
jgi:ABC-type histidine transport system ATPase subunit